MALIRRNPPLCPQGRPVHIPLISGDVHAEHLPLARVSLLRQDIPPQRRKWKRATAAVASSRSSREQAGHHPLKHFINLITTQHHARILRETQPGFDRCENWRDTPKGMSPVSLIPGWYIPSEFIHLPAAARPSSDGPYHQGLSPVHISRRKYPGYAGRVSPCRSLHAGTGCAPRQRRRGHSPAALKAGRDEQQLTLERLLTALHRLEVAGELHRPDAGERALLVPSGSRSPWSDRSWDRHRRGRWPPPGRSRSCRPWAIRARGWSPPAGQGAFGIISNCTTDLHP